MDNMSSPSLAVLVGLLPFLLFFCWLATQLQNPPRRDTPKVPISKVLFSLALSIPLGICLLIAIAILFPPSDPVSVKLPLRQPHITVAPKELSPSLSPQRHLGKQRTTNEIGKGVRTR